jgi:carbamoyl-phosphate synthase large subunit
MIATIADSDKAESVAIIREFAAIGFQIFGTAGTARFLQEEAIGASELQQGSLGAGMRQLVDQRAAELGA